MKLESIMSAEPPVPALVKREALELTHELHERGYETDGEVKYIPVSWDGTPAGHGTWELAFFKGSLSYKCELYELGSMQIVIGSRLLASGDDVGELLDQLERLIP